MMYITVSLICAIIIVLLIAIVMFNSNLHDVEEDIDDIMSIERWFILNEEILDNKYNKYSEEDKKIYSFTHFVEDEYNKYVDAKVAEIYDRHGI